MKNLTGVTRITIPFNTLLEQSRLAKWERYLFIYILDSLRTKYPGVKVTRIQDSWTFATLITNQCQLLLDDIKEEVKKREEYQYEKPK